MTDAEIVAGYSDNTLRGIIRQLSASGQWWERLKAAQEELSNRIQQTTK